MGDLKNVNAHILSNACWCICGLSYFFFITTVIHFCCTNWMDPRLPIPKASKKWLYFISAHILRVINLMIAIADMTFEQLADEIKSDNTRVLGPWVSCSVSSRIRMSLFLSSFYTYALFCWYKVAIVTIQSPERHSPHLPIIHKKKKKKRRKHNRLNYCFGIHGKLLRREHIFLDLLWFYIHLVYIVSMCLGNALFRPSHTTNDPCERDDTHALLHALVAYIIAVLIEFIALIFIFVSPLYQLMKTKKRLFRNVFSNIKVRRHKHKNKNKKSKNEQLIGTAGAENHMTKNHAHTNSTDSSSSPAQQEFISRIKSTICRNFVSGFISILLFSVFMAIYTFGRVNGYTVFFTSGVGYIVVFACYLLNYLCLTFSYQNHWPLLLPIICAPPWHKQSTFGTQSKISLQEKQPHIPHMTPLRLNDENDSDAELGNNLSIQHKGSNAIPIMTKSRTQKGDGSLESILASSHLSTTPKYHTLNVSDNIRMQKQYDEYLQKMANQQKSMNENESTQTTATTSSGGNMEEKKRLVPSQAQENINKNLPAPKLSDKYGQDTYDDDEDDDDDDDSSEDYDSEGIDSIKLRVGSYDAVNYQFSSMGYHDDQ